MRARARVCVCVCVCVVVCVCECVGVCTCVVFDEIGCNNVHKKKVTKSAIVYLVRILGPHPSDPGSSPGGGTFPPEHKDLLMENL